MPLSALQLLSVKKFTKTQQLNHFKNYFLMFRTLCFFFIPVKFTVGFFGSYNGI